MTKKPLVHTYTTSIYMKSILVVWAFIKYVYLCQNPEEN